MRWVAVWVVLGGCASRPLDEVPIHGGTPAQERVIREAIAEFEAWIGPGRIELGRITVGGMSRGDGRYWPDARRIRLAEELEDARLREVTHHELCHAVDHQENLLNDDVPTFDEVLARVRRDPVHPLNDYLVRSDRTDRSG
jgi:hypothetical protein